MSAKLSLPGKTVLITGAARGIGAAVARQLHASGANVSLVGIEPERLRALSAELGARAAAFEADVTSLDELEAAAGGTVSTFGGIDVVIANAGIAQPVTPVAEIDVTAFERVLEINLLGVWRTVKSTLPQVIQRQGHIVLISSIYSFFNGVLGASYAMSKAGVEQLGRALRVELAASGVTVSVAYFGFIDTDMVSTVFAQSGIEAFKKAFPAFITKPMSLDLAVTKLVRGIEHRAPRITAPRWVAPALIARGPLQLLDARLARDEHVRAAVKMASHPAQ
ncbi:MAG TPA: short-chain dehydrogenase/reductase [Mycobacterium sp.]|nr:short-chain dehydrogenase/reductase [Mycobacterium sp.]